MKVKVEADQIYQLTNAEVDIAIDKYLEMQGYEAWSNLSDEDKQKIMEAEWKLEQAYLEAIKHDRIE